MIPDFDIMWHTVIILGPFNPLSTIIVEITIQQHITQPERRDSHTNVGYFNQHVEYDSNSHLEDGVDLVVEVVFNNSVCVDLIFEGCLQWNDISIDNTEDKIGEVLEKRKTWDEERHPLEL